MCFKSWTSKCYTIKIKYIANSAKNLTTIFVFICPSRPPTYGTATFQWTTILAKDDPSSIATKNVKLFDQQPSPSTDNDILEELCQVFLPKLWPQLVHENPLSEWPFYSSFICPSRTPACGAATSHWNSTIRLGGLMFAVATDSQPKYPFIFHSFVTMTFDLLHSVYWRGEKASSVDPKERDGLFMENGSSDIADDICRRCDSRSRRISEARKNATLKSNAGARVGGFDLKQSIEITLD